jgi:hypothetical protein
MIALEVSLNGKRVCIAGADDCGVLTATVAAVGKLGKATVPARPGQAADIHYNVGGLTSRNDPKKDVHFRWKSAAPLSLGDTIQVKVVETRRPILRAQDKDLNGAGNHPASGSAGVMPL